MKRKSLSFLFMLALLTLTLSVSANKVDIVVSEDSWVSENAPDKNNNGITDLECGTMNTDTLKTREVYLKFDLTNISGFVKSADIKMVGAQKNDAGWAAISDFFIEVYGTSDDWSESEITWNNKPKITSGALAEANIQGFKTYKLTGDALVNFINEALLNGKTSVNIVVKGKNETNGSRIWISDKGWEPVHLILDVVEVEKTSVIADAWVSEDAPDANYNGITDMQVAKMDTDSLKSREAYVKFDISGFSGYVEAAALSITSAQKELKDGWIELDHFYIDVYGTKNGWDEKTLTWKTKPANKSGVLATIDVTKFGRYVINSETLNAYITQALAAGDKEISFVFRGRNITNGSRIWISDKGWESVKLQLSTFDVEEMSVIQDTWVGEDVPDKNNNGITDMEVAMMNTDSMKTRETFVQFDISQLDGYVNHASLRVTCAQKSTKDGYIELDKFYVQVVGSSNDWDETTLTWNTKPAINTQVLAEANITGFTSYEIGSEGLIEYINKAIANKHSKVSFVFKGRDLTNGSRIWISDKGWMPVKLVVSTINANVISVLEDSWISEDAPELNKNGITDLEVAKMNTDTLKSREAFFKFDISGLTGPQAQATLRIVSAQKEVKDGWIVLPEFNIGVYGAGTNWQETTINWSNKTKADQLLATKNITGFAYYYITSPELTDYVNKAIIGGKSEVSFAIKGLDITNGSRIWISDKGWEPAKLILDNGIRSVVNVAGVELNKTTLTLDAGQTETLIATIIPDDASNKKVKWESNNIMVAIVADGNVSAQSNGTAIVKVTTDDGAYSATCIVTVGTTGIAILEENTLKVFPNPATNRITVQIPNSSYQRIVLRDLSGRIVKQVDIQNEKEQSVDLVGISKGSYTVSLQGHNGTRTSLIIID